jgi:uncharacterized protein (TIGR02599 family)
MKRLNLSRLRAGFTLTEVLVSSALIVGIMALMLTTVDQTRRTISNTTSRVSQFQSARVAFEAMTRALGQATLNTYYDLDRSGDANQNPFGYRRQSDLHFICGEASQAKLLGTKGVGDPTPRNSAHFPGHAVFFQAPLGVTAEENVNSTSGGAGKERTYRGLTNLLSVVGYYVKWGEDESRPQFMGTTEKFAPKRNRFRLMQVQQAAETVMVYTDVNYTNLNAQGLKASTGVGYSGPTDWVHVATGIKNFPNAFKEKEGRKRIDYSRSLAENVVALIIVPKVPKRDRAQPNRLDDLTDTYEYDSCPLPAFESQKREFDTTSAADLSLMRMQLNEKAAKQLHQLPPILQVTMIAIDEESGAKLADYSEEPPDWTSGRFARLSTEDRFMQELGDPADPSTESLIYRIGNPDRSLPTPPMKYRVFTTDVVLRGSKWSK